MMEFLENHETLTYWLTQYGSFALFGLLALGIILLPIPDETLLILAGVFASKGKLLLLPTIIASFAGSMCGITVSFLLGAGFGKYLINHYGGWIGFTQSKRDMVYSWFKRYGKWTLVFGYFIPGVRHLTGVLAGMGKLEYPQFALFAYSGAAIWASTFLSLGYFLGDYWVQMIENLEISSDTLLLVFLVIITIYIIKRLLEKK
jgi:membrane protein DedA with SNARE-associated domain